MVIKNKNFINIDKILIILFFFIISLLILLVIKKKEGFDNINIIGYIHICQEGEWKRSFNMLIETIKSSELYNNTNEIRIGIVNKYGKFIKDEILNDKKFKIIYIGNNKEYERPTLLHMRNSKDRDNTLYYYLHTKGISHFNTVREKVVIKWINNMLNSNIINWKKAVKVLQTYDTYGSNYNDLHYSGNFWWATKKHINTLPDFIEDYYTGPEDWVLKNKNNMYCNDNCGENYKPLYPKWFYNK